MFINIKHIKYNLCINTYFQLQLLKWLLLLKIISQCDCTRTFSPIFQPTSDSLYKLFIISYFLFVLLLVIILMTIFEVSEIFFVRLKYVSSECDYVIVWKNVHTNQRHISLWSSQILYALLSQNGHFHYFLIFHSWLFFLFFWKIQRNCAVPSVWIFVTNHQCSRPKEKVTNLQQIK